MGLPILFVVHDDDRVLDALAGDLTRRFEPDYRVLSERSPEAGLKALERLDPTSDEVAVLIAAQHMRDMTGVDFLIRGHELHPEARRALLVGRRQWTASNPAVKAMMRGHIDIYLFEPWLPAERWLYLPISEVLADWIGARARTFEGIRIVGPRVGVASHELRDTLQRMGVPHGLYPADSDEGRELLEVAGEDGSNLPVVVFHSGRVLVAPSHAELLEALGFGIRPAADAYDVAIVGAGPAGLAAAVYAASEGLETLILEPEVAGGQAGTSALIRNYLGFPRGVSGNDLANRALEQAWLFGANFVLAQQATGLRADGDDRLLKLSDGGEVHTKAVVIASGVSWRRLGVQSLEALQGAGVYYGAAGSEARAMEGQEVYVIGAGNSAGQAALYLARYAARVTILVRDDSLASKMSDYLVQQIERAPNIVARVHTEVVEGHGSRRLEGVTILDRASGASETLDCSALFVMIGAEPHTDWLRDSGVAADARGYLLTGADLSGPDASPGAWPLERAPLLLETSLPGVFAAGDVRYRSVKRVASAVGEGAIAIQLVHDYLRQR